MTCSYIFWTTGSLKEAKEVSKALLEKKLIACANIIPKIHSLYTWKGEVQEEEEVKVIFKTKSSLFESIEKEILERCSYETPEISSVPLDQVHKPYIEWLNQTVL